MKTMDHLFLPALVVVTTAVTLAACGGGSSSSSSSSSSDDPVANLANSQEAAVVIGQPDFESRERNQGGDDPAANTLDEPSGNAGFANDTLYLGDLQNHRVLLFNGIPTTNNMVASEVLGQE